MRKPSLDKSFGYAFRGIGMMILSERNFQIHLFALLINFFLIIVLQLNSADAAIIIIVSVIVLITEMLNTCVEKICDFIHPEFHLNIGKIKDISAGAVLIATLGALVTAVLMYGKYL